MTYETQFDAGERQAFQDRKRCQRQARPQRPLTEEESAWWDGYCARNPAWSNHRVGRFVEAEAV